MNVGIIGLGVVGAAVQHGLQRVGHRVIGYDVRLSETTFEDILDTEMLFICVPTPLSSSGRCDVSIVEMVARDLDRAQFQGLTVIKSTVQPGTTDWLAKQMNLRLAFCPEFLRERAAYTDFVDNHELLVIGAYDDNDFIRIRDLHRSLPKHVVQLTPIEAELCKYFSNVFNALRIVFANEFFEVATALGADYSRIKQAMVHRSDIPDRYLDCNEQFRGFGGVCLPKDTRAFAQLAHDLELDLCLFDTIVAENEKFKTTVPAGMRP
jgi:UDPglucose 6-dehydrogenase